MAIAVVLCGLFSELLAHAQCIKFVLCFVAQDGRGRNSFCVQEVVGDFDFRFRRNFGWLLICTRFTAGLRGCASSTSVSVQICSSHIRVPYHESPQYRKRAGCHHSNNGISDPATVCSVQKCEKQ